MTFEEELKMALQICQNAGFSPEETSLFLIAVAFSRSPYRLEDIIPLEPINEPPGTIFYMDYIYTENDKQTKDTPRQD
jgi:hypothetical protein